MNSTSNTPQTPKGALKSFNKLLSLKAPLGVWGKNKTSPFRGLGLVVIRVSGLTFLLLLSSCSANFSFTGASIPPDVKSFSVQYLQNQAPLAGPTVASGLTDALRTYITSHSKLNLSTSGDVDLQGAITGYATAPVTAASATSGVSATTRLTITVQITYTDKNDEKKNFNASFSRYADFPSSQNFNVVQADLITQIDNQLVQDIFDKAFNNW